MTKQEKRVRILEQQVEIDKAEIALAQFKAEPVSKDRLAKLNRKVQVGEMKCWIAGARAELRKLRDTEPDGTTDSGVPVAADSNPGTPQPESSPVAEPPVQV